MKYINLGRSGLKVSQIILGCMSYGVKRPKDNLIWVLEEEEAMKHLKYAYDSGINAFDTADTYSQGDSERILGKFLKKYEIPRESVVIMTKTYMEFGEKEWYGPAGFVNNSRLSRKRIFAAVKNSLERLQTDYVDVFQCHRFDKDTPIEETMQALHDIVQAGYTRYIGMSSCWAWQFQLMQQYALHKNLTPFITMQNYHNAIYREEEREMMPTLQHFGVGCIPWSPLGGGALCRPIDTDPTERSKVNNKTFSPSTQAIIRQVEKIASNRGVTMAQVALAWSISKPFISAPIVGTTSLIKLEDLIKGCELELTVEEVKSIDELYEPMGIMGHV
ncbi:hypothetical protein M231_02287 [Tremella mesenterica]|uniref:NADP-dependent oxidoreductase domain-containing protein n=1 Tax=Tremella mesenterica TaxID=5217 RepID=A0A4Q1BR86_TREME|nr:uncharacterized protein TREMEDRAFT_65402 [Tremella mesenterica DSM 1558]EIW66533.1 hypothetical protein TREMEDRAFT_65402 [Tremella mesenterica DSM 1558]RXK40454.1 hypothetical protein M231_02287 [Tremella mesenterica]